MYAIVHTDNAEALIVSGVDGTGDDDAVMRAAEAAAAVAVERPSNRDRPNGFSFLLEAHYYE